MNCAPRPSTPWKPSRGLAALALAALAPIAPAAPSVEAKIVGHWSCLAQSPEGELYSEWFIKEEEGTLVVEVEIERIKRPAREVRSDGRTLTMKVDYQATPYDVSVTFDGDAFEGTWTGEGREGPLRGRRMTAS